MTAVYTRNRVIVCFQLPLICVCNECELVSSVVCDEEDCAIEVGREVVFRDSVE